MRNKIHLNIGLAVLLLLPALPTAPKTYETVNFNITFAPDLSNRVDPKLYPKPLTDPQVLSCLLKNIDSKLLSANDRNDYQMDKIGVDFLNQKLIPMYHVNTSKLLIDFAQFKEDQLRRISYIKKYKGFEQFNLQADIKSMSAEYARINGLAVKQHYGADVWTYFNEGIDGNQVVLKADAPTNDQEGNTYINKYRNVLILLTDGYIEAGIFNKGFDLSQKYIDDFRNAFNKSGETDLQKFFDKNKQYRIKPVHNPNLKNLEVLIMEMYDRSTTSGGEAKYQPTDMQIMRIFWTDWLKQAGVKHIGIYPVAKSPHEAENIMLNFLGV